MWDVWQHIDGLWSHLQTYIILRMDWRGFAVLTKSSPTAWVHWCLDGSNPCVTTYPLMRMTWWFCSSHQIWFHGLRSLRLGWITSLCIDYVPGLSDLAHTPTKHVEWMITYPHPVVLSPNNILNPGDGVLVFQFLPDLVAQLGCSEARMNRIL